MNNLEMFAIFTVVFLDLSIRDIRNLMRHVQPWEAIDWLWAIYYGLMLCVSSILVVYLATHSAAIQPVPTWLSWPVGLGFALGILAILVRLAVHTGRRICRLGR